MSSASAQTWSTATSTHAENGRVIIFRFVDALRPDFEASTQPVRVIIQWKYEQEVGSGMPSPEEHARMNAMEDLLDPAVSQDGFATLALVSTGEHLREWVYYSRSEEEFISRLNQAFAGQAPFPLEIHVAEDAEWRTWCEFKSGLQR